IEAGRGSKTEGGKKNARQKKKKKKKDCFFFFGWTDFFCAPFYISNQYFDIKKRKGEGVRTSLVLSEHASTVRCLVRVCVLSRNFEEQNNEEAKAIRGAI